MGVSDGLNSSINHAKLLTYFFWKEKLYWTLWTGSLVLRFCLSRQQVMNGKKPIVPNGRALSEPEKRRPTERPARRTPPTADSRAKCASFRIWKHSVTFSYLNNKLTETAPRRKLENWSVSTSVSNKKMLIYVISNKKWIILGRLGQFLHSAAHLCIGIMASAFHGKLSWSPLSYRWWSIGWWSIW